MMNSRTVATEGGQVIATLNKEGVCIMFLTAVPMKIGEMSAGQVVKCQVAMNLKLMTHLTKCPTGCCHDETVDETKTALPEAACVVNGDVVAKAGDCQHSLQETLVTTSCKSKEDVEVPSGEKTMEVATIALVHPNDLQCQVMKDVGCTVGSDAKCTANELMVVLSVHGSDKKMNEKTVAHDPGGGMPDTLTSDTGDGAPEAKVMNGDMYSGGDDSDQVATNRSVDDPKVQNGADSSVDMTVKQCSKEEVEKVKRVSLMVMMHDTNSLPTMTNQLGLSYSMVMSMWVKSEQSMDSSAECMVVFRWNRSCDVGSMSADEAASAGGQMCTLSSQEKVKQSPGKEFYKGANLDEAAVTGVVTQGGTSKGDAKDASSSDAILSMSGTEMSGGASILSTECNMMTLVKKSQAPLMVVDNQLVAMTSTPQGDCKTVCDNKLSGNPNSDGTLLVLCGALQTEAMPDTDVNGTSNALVKDSGIGKEQKTMTIVVSGSLKDETEWTCKDVETYVVEDVKCYDDAEVCNKVELSVPQAEKISKENGDKALVDKKVFAELVSKDSQEVSKGSDAVVTKVKEEVSTKVTEFTVQVTHVQQGVVGVQGVGLQGGPNFGVDVGMLFLLYEELKKGNDDVADVDPMTKQVLD